MKKRIFTLLAVLVLCFALFSCGKDEATLVVESLMGVGDVYGDSEIAKIFDSDTTGLRVSVCVDTLKGLEEYAELLGDIEVPEVEDLKAEVYIDLDKIKLAQVLSAKVEGEKIELTAVEDLENATIKSNLLDEVYGVETKDLLEDWMGAKGTLSALEDAIPALVDFIAKSEKISDRYEKALKEIIRDAVDIDKEKDGKYTVLSFEIGVKEMDDILDGLAEVLEDDEELEALFDAFGADLGDIADMMSESFDDEEGDEEIEFELTVLAGKSKLVAMEVVAGQTKIEYEGNDKNNDFTLEVTNGTDNIAKVSLEDGEYEVYSKSSYTYGDGDYYLYENTFSATFDKGELTLEAKNLSESKWGSDVDRDEEKASVTLGYKTSGNKLTLTLKGIGYGGISVDGIDKKVGVTVEIEKNPSVPNGAKKYEEIDDVEDFNEDVIAPLSEELRDLFTFREVARAEVRAD